MVHDLNLVMPGIIMSLQHAVPEYGCSSPSTTRSVFVTHCALLQQACTGAAQNKT